MKKLIFILLIFVSLISCEKDPDYNYYMVNIQSKDPYIHVSYDFYNTGCSIEDSSNYTGINYFCRHESGTDFIFTVTSTDSIWFILTLGIDTLYVVDGYKRINFRKRL